MQVPVCLNQVFGSFNCYKCEEWQKQFFLWGEMQHCLKCIKTTCQCTQDDVSLIWMVLTIQPIPFLLTHVSKWNFTHIIGHIIRILKQQL